MSNAGPIIAGVAGAVVIILTVEKLLPAVARLFHRPGPLFPASHETAMAHVRAYVALVKSSPDADDMELARQLSGNGISLVDAQILTRLVPTGFAIPVLKRMGAKSFAGEFFLYDERNRPAPFPFDREHYFTAALQIASELLENGYDEFFDRATCEAIIARSWELQKLNEHRDSGGKVEGWAPGNPCYHCPDADAFAEERTSK